ncbi:MAG: hypothetical protein MUP98_15000 [Candidatus Aminicenantes bacterium]|nr:hypothetical protein [Candidatus Aminicenantes bacterium]
MNKKSLVIISILVFVYALNLKAASIQIEQLSREEKIKWNEQAAWEWTEVIKTYQLKHIKPEVLIDATRLYIIDATVYKNTVTVKITNKNVPIFEDLLKKMDVEKKNILFKVYTIAATRESEKKEIQEKIEDKGLMQVLDELKNLWNFQSYKIDNPFFITVKEDSGSSFFHLASEIYSSFGLLIQQVNLNTAESGKRNITIGQIQLLQSPPIGKDQIFIDSKSITVKEDGYLVVGVSGMSIRGKVLILVISADIKD